jgi:hypothetical protein
MTLRLWILVVGVLLIAGGLTGLFIPLSVSDASGQGVGCGSAAIEDASGAQSANGGTDFVLQCGSAISNRRMWSIPMVLIGGLAAIGSTVKQV